MSVSEKKQKMVKLSWDILKYKYHYYVNDKPIISDYDYDMIEKEYEALCKEFDVPPSATDMVGFNWNRRACQLVASKEQGIDYDMWVEGRLRAAPPRKNKRAKKNTKSNSN